MLRRPALAALALLGLAGGCSSGALRPADLQAWVGRPAATLERDWGPATREVEDGALRLLIYEQLERRSASDFQKDDQARQTRGTYGAAQALAIEAARGPTVYARSYLFWVSREGAIVRADVREP